MKLTALERKIFSDLMKKLDNYLSNAGCNDYRLENSEEARTLLREMIRSQYGESDQKEALEQLESSQNDDYLYAMDFILLPHLLGKVNQILDQE